MRIFNIISENSKIYFLEKLGVEYYFSLKFDHSIASLTPRKFIKKNFNRSTKNKLFGRWI